MAINLLELLSKAASPEVVQSISKLVGESSVNVQSGFGTLLPVLLGGLASKVASPGGAGSLLTTLATANIDAALPTSLGSGAGSGSLAGLGSSLLGGLFGADKAGALGAALSTVTGMRSANAANFISLVVPMAFGVLKKFVADKGLDAGGLVTTMAAQKDFLADKLDPRLTSALGLGSPAALLGSLGGLGAGAANVVRPVGQAAAAATAVAGSAMQRMWPWIAGAVVLIAALLLLSRCNTAPVVPAATVAAPVAAVPAMQLPAKVYFETGSAALGADGNATIKAAAGLLAAKSGLKVDITGYTDKTGDSAANETLAKSRALAVKAALEAAGVATDRVATKPPVFVEVGPGGATPEGRRVDIVAQ